MEKIIEKAFELVPSLKNIKGNPKTNRIGGVFIVLSIVLAGYSFYETKDMTINVMGFSLVLLFIGCRFYLAKDENKNDCN